MKVKLKPALEQGESGERWIHRGGPLLETVGFCFPLFPTPGSNFLALLSEGMLYNAPCLLLGSQRHLDLLGMHRPLGSTKRSSWVTLQFTDDPPGEGQHVTSDRPEREKEERPEKHAFLNSS